MATSVAPLARLNGHLEVTKGDAAPSSGQPPQHIMAAITPGADNP